VGNDLKQAIRLLANNFTTEVTPTSAAKIANFTELVPRGAHVYITFLPGSDYKDTVALAKRLRNEGVEPVPHFPARSILDKATLEDFLARIRGEADVTRVLAIAGAPDKPSGIYSDTMGLLATGAFEKHGIRSVAVAGHPEGCGCGTAQVLTDALKWKANYARQSGLEMRIVTQFCFEPEPIIAYDRMLQREGIDLPLHVGLAGIASLKTLIGYAMSCGVGNSVNFLKRQAANVTRLLKPEAPDRIIRALAVHRSSESASRIAGLHYFPLGGLRKTAIWGKAVAQGSFEMDTSGGLAVAADLG
jgi:methylenetetrahydrofolate reductase (NADPH)